MFYTGIGSRQTPEQILHYFTDLAGWLSKRDYILRSGGADGADSAFELGAPSNMQEIYLPWQGFNDKQSLMPLPTKSAFDIARRYHPAWERLSQGACKLHARNVYQILGTDLNTPSDFVLCWTLNGAGTGGTGQALRIAKHYGVPVFDFGRYTDIETIRRELRQFFNWCMKK